MSKKAASFLVIFSSFLTNKKKKNIPITKNTLATAKGEKSPISIGQIIATIPKTKVAGPIIAPIKSPNTSHEWFFLAEVMAKKISGAQLPKPTTNSPIKIKDKLKVLAKN